MVEKKKQMVFVYWGRSKIILIGGFGERREVGRGGKK